MKLYKNILAKLDLILKKNNMFLILAGDHHYPLGSQDIKGKYNTLKEAEENIVTHMTDDSWRTEQRIAYFMLKDDKYSLAKYEWVEIFDLDKMEIVNYE